MRAPKKQVTRCWHPEPKAPLIEAVNGSMIEVLAGAPALQHTDGTIVTL